VTHYHYKEVLKDQSPQYPCLFVHVEWILNYDEDGSSGQDMNFWIGRNGCLAHGIW
jgi:hypothetical protein